MFFSEIGRKAHQEDSMIQWNPCSSPGELHDSKYARLLPNSISYTSAISATEEACQNNTCRAFVSFVVVLEPKKKG